MYYTKVSNDLIRCGKNLKANPFRVLVVLMSYENLEKGCSYPSHKRLEKETGLAKNTLMKCLDELEEKGYIKREKENGKTNKYYMNATVKNGSSKIDTSINFDTGTILKFDTTPYSNLIPKNKQENKHKNNKKEKKEIKTNLDLIIEAYTNNNDLVEAIKDFVKMRKTIKKPITDRGLKGILNKLDLYGDNDIEKIEILENSIMNCWQGVFELKNKKVPTGISTNENKNSNYNSSICNNYDKYTKGVKMV